MKQIVISESGFSLPSESITSTFAILAKRGAGKSNTAAVMAEEFFKCGLPFVVIDPVGAWWGLRAGTDGTPEGGLPIPIFGGEHGDLPLERTGGELIADLVISKRLSCVLDLSGFDSEAAKRQFLLGFALRIYRKNRNPLHLFLEEADDYIPQKPQKGDLALLGAMERLVRQGRAKCGIGVTMITQRSAAINKGVLTQTDTLIVLRTTGPHDQAAIKEWVKYHQVDNSIVSTLSELRNGEAWIWSPEFLEKTERVQILRRRTFDSGATPKNIHANEAQKAATLADINLGELRERMAASVEAFKENDPKELKKRIAELEGQLRGKKFGAEDAKQAIEDARAAGMAEGLAAGYRDGILEAHRVIDGIDQLIHQENDRITSKVTASLSKGAAIIPKDIPTAPAEKAQTAPLQKPVIEARGSANGDLKPVQRVILQVLAQQPDKRMTRRQVAILGGYSTAGAFSRGVSDLVARDYVRIHDGHLAIMADGLMAAGGAQPLPTGDQLHEYWISRLGSDSAPGRILGHLIGAYPESLTRGQIAEALGYSTAGAFSRACSKLIAIDLVKKHEGGLRAAEELF